VVSLTEVMAAEEASKQEVKRKRVYVHGSVALLQKQSPLVRTIPRSGIPTPPVARMIDWLCLVAVAQRETAEDGNKQAQIELDIEARAAAAKQAAMQSAAEDAEAAEVKAAAVAAAATAAEEAALLDQERRLRRDERKCPHTSQAEHCQHFLFHNKPRCCAWYI
jgi:hypothetical protein